LLIDAFGDLVVPSWMKSIDDPKPPVSGVKRLTPFGEYMGMART